MQKYNIYGDNIVECERMLSLLYNAFNASEQKVTGNLPAPTMTLVSPAGDICCQFFPGFGRWQNDIIATIRSSGGVLREAPDIIITKNVGNNETPVLAIEFCSALPAGNQAWQRSGRAYSTVRSNIPYLFVTEIGGYELDANRNKKAPRLPNPAIPFSFVSYSILTNRQVTIAYTMNPGADFANKTLYQDIVAGNDLLQYIKGILLGQDVSNEFNKLQTKVFSFVTKLSKDTNGDKSLSASQWETVYSQLQEKRDTSIILRESLFEWKKKISIPVQEGFSYVFQKVPAIATAVCSKDLPFCVIEKSKIKSLTTILHKAYPGIPANFSDSISHCEKIAICWVNGFKPKGDDARPDRGLLPFLRMLLGDQIHVLTFVYGPATLAMTKKLNDDPEKLSNENGLWEALISLSDFIICDSMRSHTPVFQFGRVRTQKTSSQTIAMPRNLCNFPEESKIGENDVDSVIHVIFAHLLHGECFESMCNPPGGDWSGVSLLHHNYEYRWLTLPRVSASASKRPDHVIQLPSGHIISIESKDYLRNLENNIGPRLNQYCKDLFATPPSCKKDKNDVWDDNVDSFKLPALQYVSGSAFIETSISDTKNVLNKADTDFAFVISFSEGKTILKIVYRSTCPSEIKELFRKIDAQNFTTLLISEE